ncbi:hypothetical protein [Bradyrhizobium sp. HKCCYLR1023]|uniref:hypothetical protein n=1 Tax=Bradyrhizobium TaxID=374 RepID=UPI003EBBB57E
MLSYASTLIARRHILVRALGITATGAALPLPLIVADTPEARIAHHLREACNALQELYPEARFQSAFRRRAAFDLVCAGDIVAVIKAAERNPPPGLESS